MPDRPRTPRFELLAGREWPVVVDTKQPAQRIHLGRAYRAGRLICGCVHVTVSADERLGLTQRERRRFRARFHEPLDDELRSELTQLVRRRGAAALRIAAELEEIEIALEDPRGEGQRIIGHLQPPQVRHRWLRDFEFEFGVRPR
jgi:hypothetical protein